MPPPTAPANIEPDDAGAGAVGEGRIPKLVLAGGGVPVPLVGVGARKAYPLQYCAGAGLASSTNPIETRRNLIRLSRPSRVPWAPVVRLPSLRRLARLWRAPSLG